MNETKPVGELTPWQPVEHDDWQLTQIKYLYDVILGKMLQKSAQSSQDIKANYLKSQHVQWDGVKIDNLPTMWASPSQIEKLRVRKGDLLVCEGGEVGRAALLLNEPPENCIIQNALHLVRPKPRGHLHFLRYLLQHATSHKWLDVLCNRTTIAHFTSKKFNQMWLWVPPLCQQRAIVDYLDRETAKLDESIADMERLIELLAEKQQALIAHAVIHGLNPNVPMRNSGVEWLGKIPAHWEVIRIAFIIDIDTAYYSELFRIDAFKAEAARYSSGAVSHHIGLSLPKIRDICVPVPPLNEQNEMVSYITHKTTQINELYQAIKQMVELLHERRTALIAAAVSGKMEVTK